MQNYRLFMAEKLCLQLSLLPLSFTPKRQKVVNISKLFIFLPYIGFFQLRGVFKTLFFFKRRAKKLIGDVYFFFHSYKPVLNPLPCDNSF